MRNILLLIGLMAMLFICVAGAMLASEIGTATDNAAPRLQQHTDQQAAAVCIGLNIFSCRTSQQNGPERGQAGESNPWPTIMLLTALIAPAVLAVGLSLQRQSS
jgi:hypothetical protein